MAKFTTVIIDDEKIARDRLRRLLSHYEDLFQIVGEASNGFEGMETIKRLNPDVIFLDIQMPGKTGFEMLNELDVVPIVVFCTAYEEFALEAFNTMALDYLVKPVEQERLQLTVDKLKRAKGTISKSQIESLIDLVNQKETHKLNSVPHKIGDRVILVKPERITYFSANEKHVDFYTLNGEKYMTELSLKKLEERLPQEFKRVHRGVIVNTNHIKEFRKYFRGKYIIVLDDVNHTKIESGRSFAEEIREFIHFE